MARWLRMCGESVLERDAVNWRKPIDPEANENNA
jgi:hypothetical protein